MDDLDGPVLHEVPVVVEEEEPRILAAFPIGSAN